MIEWLALVLAVTACVGVVGLVLYVAWDYRKSKAVGALTTSALAAAEGAEDAARRLAREQYERMYPGAVASSSANAPLWQIAEDVADENRRLAREARRKR